jgi:hypothetical protein
MHQNFEEIRFVEGAIWVGDHFCGRPAKLTRRGCTAFSRFWQGLAEGQKVGFKKVLG